MIAHSEPEDASSHAISRLPPRRRKPGTWRTSRRALRSIYVRAARVAGHSVTCEVTPHHLTFTARTSPEFGPAARVNPPLRTARRRRGACARPCTTERSMRSPAITRRTPRARKRDGSRRRVLPGSRLPSAPMRRRCRICRCCASSNCSRPIPRASSACPAARWPSVRPPTSRSSPTGQWTVDPASFASKGRCTPFAGRRLPRRSASRPIVGGELRYGAPGVRGP